MSLKNKTALITGASSGIGAACARKLAERGCSVIASARNKKKIQSLAESINGHFIVADLSDTNQIEKLFSEAGETVPSSYINRLKAIGALVCAACRAMAAAFSAE